MIASSSSSLSFHFLGENNQFPATKQSPPPSSSIRFKEGRVNNSACCSSASAPPSACYMATSSSSSLYDLLGIQKFATGQEIKAAYRKLARVCHPDVVKFDRKDTSSDEFMKINAAYSTLSDPQKRADYDRSLFTRQRSFAKSASNSGFDGYTSRNWETDQCW